MEIDFFFFFFFLTYLACYRALIHGWLVFDMVTAN